MLHPKHLVLATPEVLEGAPILAIVCSPDLVMNGEASGWMFLHVHNAVPDDAEPHFFEDLPELDASVRIIVEGADPGYTCASRNSHRLTLNPGDASAFRSGSSTAAGGRALPPSTEAKHLA